MHIKFFLSSVLEAVEKDCSIWRSRFPLSVPNQNLSGTEHITDFLTYGDYFAAVQRFLEKDEYRVITNSLVKRNRNQFSHKDIEEIRIFLVKHGELYHPCRVETLLKGEIFQWVVNVAMSCYGKALIYREFNIIKMLNLSHACSFLPGIYEYGEVRTEKCEIKMFMGEWFSAFHEFHISFDNHEGKYKIRVWDQDKENWFLNSQQTKELYRQIAMILTCYYDIETFGQIYPWHHAAGDFIINCSDNSLQSRLITVRNFGSLLETSHNDEDTILEAMLFFLVNLSIRTRLDRIDGIGETVWAGSEAVKATILGFYAGLSWKNSQWSDKFKNYTSLLSFSGLSEICETVVNSYIHDSPELPIIRKQLAVHSIELFDALSKMRVST